MIGRIKGVIVEKQPPFLLIDINGIAYECLAPMTTFYHLPDVGQSVALHTHFVVREDSQTLYGFAHKSERNLFRCLIKINGVGPKLALMILSNLTSQQLVECIHARDHAKLTGIPGIGKKTAERLLVEMSDVIDKWYQPTPEEKHIELPKSQAIDEAISALIALGYKAKEAKNAIDKVYSADCKSEQLIRLALQNMGKVHG